MGLILIVMISFFPLTVLGAENNYQMILWKGTENYKIITYDKEGWEKNIGTALEPEDIFGKNSDEENAESKYTIRAIYESDWSLIDLISSTILGNLVIPIILINYTPTELDKEFSEEYEVWYGLQSRWKYTLDEFEYEPDIEAEKHPFIKDPNDFGDILEKYNDLAQELNNTFMPELNGDDFLWYLLISHIGIPDPVEKYLDEMVEILDSKDAEVNSNTITLERSEKEDIIVEVVYTSQGIIESIKFKDTDEDIFYEIQHFNDRWVVYTILGIISVFIIGLTVYAFRRKKNLR